jgi:hypothetical protein
MILASDGGIAGSGSVHLAVASLTLTPSETSLLG